MRPAVSAQCDLCLTHQKAATRLRNQTTLAPHSNLTSRLAALFFQSNSTFPTGQPAVRTALARTNLIPPRHVLFSVRGSDVLATLKP